MKRDLSRFFPPGMNTNFERQFVVGLWVCSLIFSLTIFMGNYFNARSNLFAYYGGNNTSVMRPDAEMQPFGALAERTMIGFTALILCMVGFAIYHYMYHKQGSKSIYLMRRLPDKGELHRRCLTVPIAVSLLAAVTVVILVIIYIAVYIFATPKGCIHPPVEWGELWRVMI